ncbi:di-heme oxidoredictase family protein [Psychromonas algicola]|uniref:di-heme oxidoredictase family protein n=1 Tax=Psychromonas algicola TaxID=2555642 RepID=UPI0010679835|nr:di-heme oxidoredictase family protein [Psychromonas sp. RZ5]TEW51799.1 thiol oxidoreductase [Psychromonas sp. RZ5]
MKNNVNKLVKQLFRGIFLFLATSHFVHSETNDKTSTFNTNEFTHANGSKPFSQPIKMNDEEFDQYILGRSFFTIPWVEAPSATTARDGLGPHFSSNTCVSCHINNGSAPTISDQNQPLRSLVFKLTQPSQHSSRFLINNLDTPMHDSVPDPVYGAQVSIRGNGKVKAEAQTRLKTESRSFTYPDGQSLTLTKLIPYLDNLAYGPLAKETVIALRQPPTLAGLRLIEQVSNEDILAWEDPLDENGDGISGRANWLNSPVQDKKILGRLNWKASASSIVGQTAAAAAHDLGLTNPFFPEELCQPAQADCLAAPKGDTTRLGHLDLPMLRLQAIASFIRDHKAPKTMTLDAQGQQGKKLFESIGCASCHRPTLTTNKGIEFEPYSDLLLHDMGDELQDGRPEFLATEREFRTAVLWGVGDRVRKQHRFLHDARAKTPEEAILWHGGEAEIAKSTFIKLTQAERLALLHFLEQL